MGAIAIRTRRNYRLNPFPNPVFSVYSWALPEPAPDGAGLGPTAAGVGREQDTMEKIHRQRLDNSMRRFFFQAILASITSPRQFRFLLGLALSQARQNRRRRKLAGQGLACPPVLILSVTQSCNLSCSGCYHRALHRDRGGELDAQRFASIVREAWELGAMLSLVAGGEPFARADLWDIFDSSHKMLFPVFTNGLLIGPEQAAKLRLRPNVFPLISVEGRRQATDGRRGQGSWDALGRGLESLARAGIAYGHSITVNAENIDEVTEGAFIRELRARGARAFVFVEYVPMDAGGQALVLGPERRALLRRRVEALRAEGLGLCLCFPGDEEAFGGCLAAGRGFIHVNPRGGLEACPFAPFSDVDLGRQSLRQALASPLMQKIREGHSMLNEDSGCALWANREWVEGLARERLPPPSPSFREA